MLSPGVTNDGNFGLISYRGISGLYNNNMVDGVDNNQAFFSEARGRTRAVYSISSASIKEFQVGVSNMSAEFGRAAGGTVNAVTKSGTNAMSRRGLLLPARQGVPGAGSLHRRAVLGRDRRTAPAVRRRARRSDQARSRVLLRQLRPAGARLPAVRAAPSRDLLRHVHGVGRQLRRDARVLPIAAGRDDARARRTTRWASPRSTGTINAANTLSISYNGQRWRSPNGIQTQAVLFRRGVGERHRHRQDRLRRDQLEQHRQLSDSLNELRIQIGRDYEQQTPNGVGPGTSVTGGIGFGMPNFLPRPKYPYEQRYQVLDSVTYFRGAHTPQGRPRSELRQGRAPEPLPGRRRLQLHQPHDDRARLPARSGRMRPGWPTPTRADTTAPTPRRST